MIRAIELAKKTSKDIPVACIILKNNKIIAQAYNSREENNDISAHAEILAIKQAEKYLNNWRLDNCEMYVTLEPCPMCAWAILQSRIKTLYFGSYNLEYGAFGSKINLKEITNSKLKVYGGIKEKECNELLDNFFKKIRGEK